MGIPMKALKSFGYTGANEGKVRRGREFSVDSLNRAKELEAHGLAYRVDDPGMKAAPKDLKIDPELKNEAAELGPFDLAGGVIGALLPADPDPEELAPSSPRDRQPRVPPSRS